MLPPHQLQTSTQMFSVGMFPNMFQLFYLLEGIYKAFFLHSATIMLAHTVQNLINFDILSSEAIQTPALMREAQIIPSSLHIPSKNNK